MRAAKRLEAAEAAALPADDGERGGGDLALVQGDRPSRESHAVLDESEKAGGRLAFASWQRSRKVQVAPAPADVELTTDYSVQALEPMTVASSRGTSDEKDDGDVGAVVS